MLYYKKPMAMLTTAAGQKNKAGAGNHFFGDFFMGKSHKYSLLILKNFWNFSTFYKKL